MVGVAVAEVEEEIDARRHVRCQIDENVGETLLRLALVGAVARSLCAFQAREYSGCHVELNRELTFWNGLCKLVDLALDGLVVDRVEWSLQIILDVQPQHRMRRDEIDLKLDVGRNYAGALQLGEYLERADRVVGVQQIAEGDVLDAAPGTQR